MKPPGPRTFQVLTAMMVGVLFLREHEWPAWFDGVSAAGAVLVVLGAFGFFEDDDEA